MSMPMMMAKEVEVKLNDFGFGFSLAILAWRFGKLMMGKRKSD